MASKDLWVEIKLHPEAEPVWARREVPPAVVQEFQRILDTGGGEHISFPYPDDSERIVSEVGGRDVVLSVPSRARGGNYVIHFLGH